MQDKMIAELLSDLEQKGKELAALARENSWLTEENRRLRKLNTELEKKVGHLAKLVVEAKKDQFKKQIHSLSGSSDWRCRNETVQSFKRTGNAGPFFMANLISYSCG